MFIGEYQHSIDDKGRISLPAKFRADLANGCVVTRGLDNCLWIYPKNDWQELAARIAEMPVTQKNARAFARFILSGAVECQIDRNGRVNLPKYLADYAEIKGKAIVAGMYNRLEIWSESKWQSFKEEMEKNSEEIAENLEGLGF
ncbi:MAG: division/cell wall cluster transcriptional repressor MraZ [Candidatus Berkelbacteria bacterium]|nr:division/cell wall cluster transcriptional repressor MraZ [Candidatus Berkelbacteria bacterium]